VRAHRGDDAGGTAIAIAEHASTKGEVTIVIRKGRGYPQALLAVLAWALILGASDLRRFRVSVQKIENFLRVEVDQRLSLPDFTFCGCMLGDCDGSYRPHRPGEPAPVGSLMGKYAPVDVILSSQRDCLTAFLIFALCALLGADRWPSRSPVLA
jgi:hypothetical protein